MCAYEGVCVLGGLLLILHNVIISFLLSFRHIIDATLAIVKGETVPLDVLQIKVRRSFHQSLKKLQANTYFKKCNSSNNVRMKPIPLLTLSYLKYNSTEKIILPGYSSSYH